MLGEEARETYAGGEEDEDTGEALEGAAAWIQAGGSHPFFLLMIYLLIDSGADYDDTVTGQRGRWKITSTRSFMGVELVSSEGMPEHEELDN